MYGEKRITVEGEKEGEKVEYRVWNPFRYALIYKALLWRPSSIILVKAHRSLLPAGQSWQPQCWLEWTTSTSSPAARCSTWAPHPAHLSATCQTLSAPRALCMPWSSLTAAVRPPSN